jgi:hypothetical protein
MLPMTDARIADLLERAELFAIYGDRDALTADDVCEMIAEIRACHAQLAHLIALRRRDAERGAVVIR